MGAVDVEREDHEVFDDYLELVIQYGSVTPAPASPFGRTLRPGTQLPSQHSSHH